VSVVDDPASLLGTIFNYLELYYTPALAMRDTGFNRMVRLLTSASRPGTTIIYLGEWSVGCRFVQKLCRSPAGTLLADFGDLVDPYDALAARRCPNRRSSRVEGVIAQANKQGQSPD
jgi:hypothetical protein